MPYGNLFDMIAIHIDSDPWFLTLIKLLIWIGAIILLIIKSTDKVNTGDQALRRRGGKVVNHWFGPRKGLPKIYDPGQQILIPFWHSMWPTSVQDRLLELRQQEYERLDHHFMSVTVAIRFRVVDIAIALIELESVDALVTALCEKYVLKLLSQGVDVREVDEAFIAHQPALEAAAMLGVELIELSVVSAAETSSSQHASMLVAGGLKGFNLPLLAVSNGNGHKKVETSDVL